MNETPDTEKESEEYEDGKVYEIDIERLELDPDQLKNDKDPELKELIDSIIQRGEVLQPIIFRKENGKFICGS